MTGSNEVIRALEHKSDQQALVNSEVLYLIIIEFVLIRLSKLRIKVHYKKLIGRVGYKIQTVLCCVTGNEWSA